jgi:hypothetical protein
MDGTGLCDVDVKDWKTWDIQLNVLVFGDIADAQMFNRKLGFAKDGNAAKEFKCYMCEETDKFKVRTDWILANQM